MKSMHPDVAVRLVKLCAPVPKLDVRPACKDLAVMRGAGAPTDGCKEAGPRKMVGNSPIQIAPPWKLDDRPCGRVLRRWCCGRSLKDPLPQSFEGLIETVLPGLW